MERLFSSPGLYWRKKLTGREIRRIIMEACTPKEVFAFSRCVRRSFVEVINCEASEIQRIQTETPIRAFARPLFRIGPVRAAVICGISSPTTDTASVASTISTMSLTLMHCFRYSSRSGMPILRRGSGR